MTETEAKLQMAERHVRDGERHVLHQREIIEHLRAHDLPTELAERLLGTLQDLLGMHRQHLAHIRSEQP